MASLYEADFYEWTQSQAARLRALQAERANLDLDLENIAEEIDSLGRSDFRQLRSRLEELDIHLMKLAFSLAWEPRNQWRNSVMGQRRGLRELLEDSPSLKRRLAEALADAHEDAMRHFDDRKLISLTMQMHLPTLCPFAVEDMLNDDWWPEPRGEN